MNYKERDGSTLYIDTKQDTILKKLYGNPVGYAAMKLLAHPVVSRFAGFLMDSQISSICIDPFIKKNHIDLSDYIATNYHSFNEFFTRQIKHNARPIDEKPNHFIASSDGKITVYPIKADSTFTIKGAQYSLASLLESKQLARHYEGGYCIINRLTVDNYHRYCYVDDGLKSDNVFIPGKLHTVNPVALTKVNVYKENAREYSLLKSDHFGTVLQMEVGALLVGRITNHDCKCYVKKGFEKGYFEYGGSTIVTLIQKNRVKIDEDLLQNTQDGFETIVKMGEKIGEAL
jgi:phosphatidylserine decarboxylase